ncbi:hypothetical protein [Phenylobacterium sp.]|uniref:hypothetical protein n=1 Tax=Phenylobacterium sp. TaxID=1871053 RepID=UPI002F922352
MTKQTTGIEPTAPVSSVPTKVAIGPTASVDLSFLPEDERRALLLDYSRGVLDIAKKAQDLHVDIGALQSTLSTLSHTTKEVAASGASVTVTHTQTTSIGRTEIIMGNTETAQRGKLSKSQTGERDFTWLYIVAGLIALVLVVSALAGN